MKKDIYIPFNTKWLQNVPKCKTRRTGTYNKYGWNATGEEINLFSGRQLCTFRFPLLPQDT
ncbi:hypothetical protein [Pseudoflavonifractor sp.]|uniref:hypothetical protein n=1 Tax=Pseudoflavonifractor sp. TaxID=1980281 RepID=UPI003D939E52